MNTIFSSSARRGSLKLVVATALGLAASLCLTAGAEARDKHKPKSQTLLVYLAKYRSNDQTRFNKPASAKVVRVSASQYAAGTPYVCTPSGFGQKSRCFIRD